MLSRLIRYPYGNALSRALAAELESRTDLMERIRVQTQGKIRGELFPGEQGEETSLVQKCHLELQRMGKRIADSLPSAAGKLIRAYLQRSEFENLKLICRSILRGGDSPVPASLILPVPARSRLPAATMLAAASLEELAAALPRGRCRELVAGVTEGSKVHRLFLLETALDSHFWKTVRKASDRLAPFDRAAAREILGARADIDRFGMISRGVRAGCDEKTILAGLPDLGTAFPGKKISRALRSGDPAAALRDLYPDPSVDDPLSREGEIGLLRRLGKMLHKILLSHPFDISIPLAAVLLKELDILQSQVVRAGFLFGMEKDDMGHWTTETEE